MFAIHLTFPQSGNQYFLGRGNGLAACEDAKTFETLEGAQAAIKQLSAMTWVRNGRHVAPPIATVTMI